MRHYTEDDIAAMIAEAKKQVEVQRIQREKEEAADRAREQAAAESRGREYKPRRRADEVDPDEGGGGGAAGQSGAGGPERRKIVRAR